jgi:hypothetical protein
MTLRICERGSIAHIVIIIESPGTNSRGGPYLVQPHSRSQTIGINDALD